MEIKIYFYQKQWYCFGDV